MLDFVQLIDLDLETRGVREEQSGFLAWRGFLFQLDLWK